MKIIQEIENSKIAIDITSNSFVLTPTSMPPAVPTTGSQCQEYLPCGLTLAICESLKDSFLVLEKPTKSAWVSLMSFPTALSLSGLLSPLTFHISPTTIIKFQFSTPTFFSRHHLSPSRDITCCIANVSTTRSYSW